MNDFLKKREIIKKNKKLNSTWEHASVLTMREEGIKSIQ